MKPRIRVRADGRYERILESYPKNRRLGPFASLEDALRLPHVDIPLSQWMSEQKHRADMANTDPNWQQPVVFSDPEPYRAPAKPDPRPDAASDYGPKERVEDDHYCLSTRARNCLLRAGVETVWQLQAWSEKDLRAIDGLGRRTFNEILEWCTCHRVQLRALRLPWAVRARFHREVQKLTTKGVRCQWSPLT